MKMHVIANNRAAWTCLLTLLLFFLLPPSHSKNTVGNLSEYCSNDEDSDNDGIGDDCDCYPGNPTNAGLSVEGPVSVCEDEVQTYRVLPGGLHLNEIDLTLSDAIELINTSEVAINVDGYMLCANGCNFIGFAGEWKEANDNYVIDPGGLIKLEGRFVNVDSDVALYQNSNVGNPANMVSFVRIGNPVSDVIEDAVSVGLWQSTDDFIDVSGIVQGQTLSFDGFGNSSLDWELGTETLGLPNNNRTIFSWSFSGGENLTVTGDYTLEIDFSGSVDGELVAYSLGNGGCFENRAALQVNVKPLIAWYVDEDGDGYGDENADPILDCDNPGIPGVYVDNMEDCNDTDADINPRSLWYEDMDGDGLGNPGVSVEQCENPDDLGVDYVLNNLDPDDNNTDFDEDSLNDGAEVFIFNTNPALADTDMDGLDDGEELSFMTDPNVKDSDGDGCNDGDEVLNVTDPTDPQVGGAVAWYEDQDGDGYGNPESMVMVCIEPEGYVTKSGDCDDEDDKTYPNAPAQPDGKDNDCDGQPDRVAQQITFPKPADVVFGNEVIPLTAQSSSGLPVTYRVSGPARITSVGLVAEEAGQVIVTAQQGGDDFYLPADHVSQSFCVNPVRPTLTHEGIIISSSAATNRWFRDGLSISEEQGQTLAATEVGVYTAQATVDGCLSELSDALTITVITAVAEPELTALSVYPSPATNHINFEHHLNDLSGDQLRVYNLAGYQQETKISLLPGGKLQADLSHISRGVYLYKLQTSNTVLTGRFIKK